MRFVYRTKDDVAVLEIPEGYEPPSGILVPIVPEAPFSAAYSCNFRLVGPAETTCNHSRYANTKFCGEMSCPNYVQKHLGEIRLSDLADENVPPGAITDPNTPVSEDGITTTRGEQDE